MPRVPFKGLIHSMRSLSSDTSVRIYSNKFESVVILSEAGPGVQLIVKAPSVSSLVKFETARLSVRHLAVTAHSHPVTAVQEEHHRMRARRASPASRSIVVESGSYSWLSRVRRGGRQIWIQESATGCTGCRACRVLRQPAEMLRAAPAATRQKSALPVGFTDAVATLRLGCGKSFPLGFRFAAPPAGGKQSRSKTEQHHRRRFGHRDVDETE